MSNTISSLENDEFLTPFPSFNSLVNAHSELLKSYSESQNTSELLSRIHDFIRQGQTTGAILFRYEQRRDSQNLLDFWANVLYRAGQELPDLPDSTLAEIDPQQVKPLDELQCPYFGLEAFPEEKRDCFFGRKNLIDQLMKRLENNRLLVIVGASGSGKTSLVLSGLIPRLKYDDAIPGSKDWHYFPPMAPENDPLGNLARLIGSNDVEGTVTKFRSNPKYLSELIGQSVGKPAVLFVDRLKEVFTLCRDDRVRQAFIGNLLGLTQSPLKHIVILTLQRNFEDKAKQMESFKDIFEQSKVEIDPLSEQEFREVIEKPAALVDLKFEDGLVDALVKDFKPEHLVDSSAQLPLLQFALLKLWDQREYNYITWKAYKDLGGNARQILSKTAYDFYKQLSSDEQATAKKVLLKMVKPGEGGQATSDRVRREELLSHLNEPSDRVNHILEQLIKTGLVRQSQGTTDADTQVEFTHEALVRYMPLLAEIIRTEEQRRLRQILMPAALVAQALLQQRQNEDERSALLARQAYLFNKQNEKNYPEQYEAIDQVLKTISFRDVFREVLKDPDLSQDRYFSHILAGHRGEIAGVAFSPIDEQMLLASASYDGTVQLWNLKQHDKKHILDKQKCKVRSVTFSQNGRILALGGDDGSIWLWNIPLDASEPSLLQTLRGHKKEVRSVAFSPNGQMLVSGSWDQKVLLWNMTDLDQPPTTLGECGDWIWSVVFSPDGERLAAGCRDGSVWLWNLSQLKNQPTVFSIHEIENLPKLNEESLRNREIFSVAFSPNGKTLATGSRDMVIRLWDLGQPKPKLIKVLEGHENIVRSVIFSPDPDGQKLASGGDDQRVRLWDLRQSDPKPIVLESHYSGVSSVSFSPDGRLLASGCWDWTVQIWELDQLNKSPGLLSVLNNQISGQSPDEAMIFSIAFHPKDKNILASGSRDHKVKLWNPYDSNIAPIVLGQEADRHKDQVRAVAFSPDGHLLASGSRDETVKLWKLNPPHLYDTLEGHKGWVTSVAFSPDGKILASGGHDGKICVWDVDTKQCLNSLEGYIQKVWSVAFSPDGRMLAFGGEDKTTVWLWNLQEANPKPPLEGHESFVRAVAFSPDGRMLASGSYDGTVLLWNSNRPQDHPKPLRALNIGIGSLAFSLDGKTLALGCWDHTVQLRELHQLDQDTQIAKIHQPLRGHDSGVSCVAFSPLDEKILASGGHDGKICVWDAKPSSLADEVCHRVWRNLTKDEWDQFVGAEIPYQCTCGNLPSVDDAPPNAPDAAKIEEPM